LLLVRSNADDLVFGSIVGEHSDGDGIRDAFYAGTRRGGLGHLREQDRRPAFHDYAIRSARWARRRIDLPWIERWIGQHADIQTTMRYLPPRARAPRHRG
jgi:hypothetical protein